MYSSLSQQVWRPRNSVKVRFALAQGFFIAVIISLLALALYLTVRPRLVSITDNSYKILVDTLASSIYEPYQAHNESGVASAIRKVEIQSGVKYVLVVDSNNKVYYDSFSGADSLKGKDFSEDKLSKQITTGNVAVGQVTRNGTTYYNYVVPFIAGNKIVYTVRLGVDQEIIAGEFNRLASLFASLGTFGIIIGILAAYLLAARLTRPIILLTESALAIRAGNLNAYPDIETNDELEQLSREFQSMVEKLKQFYFQEYNQKKKALVDKQQLEEINTRLHELDRQKTDFLNAASHQLRTPLSVIHWSLSLIVDEAEHLTLKPEQKELLEESLKSTKRMVDLVNDMLDLSRIEQGRKELSWAKGNFASVCDQLVKALQVLANNKHLTLTYEQSGEIPDSFLDEKAFYQVVNNFVDNAIKYTAEGFVKVFCEGKGDHVEIRVQDSGIGMDEQERKALFTRFSRGTEAQKMFPNGSGLGMFVAKSLLYQHGGSIDVESEKGKGTTFILSVPFYNEIPDIKPEADAESKLELPEKVTDNKADAHNSPSNSGDGKL